MADGRAGHRYRTVEVRSYAIRHCLAAAVLAAALAAVGCGSASHNRRLEPLDRSRLSSQLSEVRDAAGRGDRSAARQALDDFTAEVRRLRRAGAIDEPTAGALLLGARRARARLEVELAPPVQTQPAQPAPPTPQPAPQPARPKPEKQPKPVTKEQPKKQEKEEGGSGHHEEGHKGGKKH
jgi:outer membrane biosynthesis protein TonB